TELQPQASCANVRAVTREGLGLLTRRPDPVNRRCRSTASAAGAVHSLRRILRRRPNVQPGHGALPALTGTRPSDCSAEGHRGTNHRSIASATPPPVLEVATRASVAEARTVSGACPIANERPAHWNMDTSLYQSPTAADLSRGMSSSEASQ